MLKTITNGAITYDIPQSENVPDGFKEVTKNADKPVKSGDLNKTPQKGWKAK